MGGCCEIGNRGRLSVIEKPVVEVVERVLAKNAFAYASDNGLGDVVVKIKKMIANAYSENECNYVLFIFDPQDYPNARVDYLKFRGLLGIKGYEIIFEMD